MAEVGNMVAVVITIIGVHYIVILKAVDEDNAEDLLAKLYYN